MSKQDLFGLAFVLLGLAAAELKGPGWAILFLFCGMVVLTVARLRDTGDADGITILSKPAQRESEQTLHRWNVPHPRNPFFTGRDDVIKSIEKALRSDGRAALVGLPGVGKTEIALEYAYSRRDCYQTVFWVNADARLALLAGYFELARLLGLPEGEAKEQELAVNAVKCWLCSGDGWLLIFDNVDDHSAIREFLPDSKFGHILLTGLDRATGAVAKRIDINEMDTEEGALLLLRRVGTVAKNDSLEAAPSREISHARTLSAELGGLPLAIEQAGAFIEETPLTIPEYLDLYRRKRRDLLANKSRFTSHSSVTVTFSIAFTKVEQIDRAAAEVLRLCCFLAANDIGEEIFVRGANDLGGILGPVASETLSFARTLREAGRFSLLRRDAEQKSVYVHRLVQAVLKDGMDDVSQRVWAERAVRAVNCAFPQAKFSNWKDCERLLAHAKVCAEHIEKWHFEFLEAGDLLNKTGYYLWHRGRYDEAEALHRLALAIRENKLGPHSSEVAASVNNLALIYHDQGRYAEAEPLYSRALAIHDKGPDADWPSVARCLNNLALLYHEQGRYAEAEPLYRRALAIRKKHLGPDHPSVGQTLNNLAGLFQAQGHYAEAEPLHLQALTIRERELGPDHPDVAASLNNLGEFYQSQGRKSEAESLFRRALSVFELAQGGAHPNVAVVLHNLSLLLRTENHLDDALEMERRAVAIREHVLVKDHPDLAASLENYAALLRSTDHSPEAQAVEARAAEIRRSSAGGQQAVARKSRRKAGGTQRAR